MHSCAGTGKSTTARESMHRVLERGVPARIIYLAFGRAIADEFRPLCPSGVVVSTMHSMGFKALAAANGCQLDNQKSMRLLKGMPAGRALPYDRRRDVVDLVKSLKSQAIRPGVDPERVRRLSLVMGESLDRRQIECACSLLHRCAEDTSTIDFDDMIWLPLLDDDLRFPQYDMIFVDEAQDLDPAQHELLLKLRQGARLFVVGDPRQAIYAFRGADSASMATLEGRAGIGHVFQLTVSRRCPRSHVELARKIVPDFESHPDAIEGEIRHGSMGDLHLAEPGDLVVCRLNAPVIAECLKRISERKPAIVRGRGIGSQLLHLYERLSKDCASPDDLLGEIRGWEAIEVARLKREEVEEAVIEGVRDRARGLAAVAGSAGDLSQVPGILDRLFSDKIDSSQMITYSSVHRAKGSEAERVFFVDAPHTRDPATPVEAQQRENLRYVALTRSKRVLYLIAAPAPTPNPAKKHRQRS